MVPAHPAVFAPGEVHTVTPFFNLVLVYNTGAAFSFLASAQVRIRSTGRRGSSAMTYSTIWWADGH